MAKISQSINGCLSFGLCLACLWIGLTVAPVAAEGDASTKGAAAASKKDSGLSNDNLQNQISALDGQIQKLREQSLALQEKTREKLQTQLDNFKQQRDTLVPRIEKLRDNSETAWQDIKENIQKAIEDLKASVDTMGKK
jgi:TolA-binding protein